jgi:transcriptional antiterminator
MKAMENTRLLNQLMDFVEKKLQVRLEKNSFDYKRLMIHLSGVIKRAETKHLLKDSIALKLKEELPFEYKLAYDISRIIGNTLKLSIPEAELIYTALHLHKIRLNSEGCSTHAEL